MSLDAVPDGSYSVVRCRRPMRRFGLFGGVVAVCNREADKSMTASSLTVGTRLSLAAADFQTLLDALAGRGYQVMGPTLEDGQLIYGEIGKVKDLPVGWTAIQAGGTFRLEPRPDQAFFGFAVGQQSWKQFLLPPRQTLYQAQREGAGFGVIPGGEAVPKFAFVGVRSCELAAMAVQDRVYLQGAYVDPTYKARREQALIVAVNCGHQEAGVCFCGSRGTGPRAAAGFDLALTEVLRGEEHFFVVEIGTMRGGRSYPGTSGAHRDARRG